MTRKRVFGAYFSYSSSYFSQIVGEINHIAYSTLMTAPFCGEVTLQMKSFLQTLFNKLTLPALSSHHKYKRPKDD